MKAFRIFLLILIIIGLAALATEKLWVPKVVNKIIADEGMPTAVQPSQVPITLKDGQQCYEYSHDATSTEPYTVNEFINMTIHGTSVIGTKTGTQSGPDMTDGYSGTIVGTLLNNTITDVFSYTIEGSANKEKELYVAGLTGIEKHRYPLIESHGILMPDITKKFTVMRYARVLCGGSD